MCAIAGICSSTNEPLERRLLERMIGQVHYRGPDDHGVYVGDGVGLANARLSIIDLLSGKQPVCNEDGSLWITFNGEIFNYVELRQELLKRGHRFATQSDTEVVIHLYEEYGEESVNFLNGQWALAIWDVRRRTLFLSRDRLGVRPLFYTLVNGTLIFASEIKSIFVHPSVPRGLDLAALDQIFTFWCTLPGQTIFRNIRELPPGHSLTLRDGRLTQRKYWHLSFESPTERPEDEQECTEKLQALLSDAVRIRMRSDVPVGAYLSGGLDSTIVTALMKDFSKANLSTFSISFSAQDLDESAFQKQAYIFLNTSHASLNCSCEDIARVLPHVIWHTEKPVIRTAPAPMYLLSQLVRDSGYKVVLTGEGADEIFGGYDIYKEAKIRRFWASQAASRWRPLLLRRLYPYHGGLQKQPDSYRQRFFHVAEEESHGPFFSHLPRWELTSRAKLFFSCDVSGSLLEYDALDDLMSQLPAEYFQWHPFCQAQYLESILLLPGYILSSQGDRVAMAHAVEARHPFLDYRLVEFGARMPCTLKMKVLNEKYILKRAFARLLPMSVCLRSKQPYRAPDGKSFFSGRLQDYVAELLGPQQIKRNGMFDPSAVGKLVHKFATGQALGVKDDMALIGILSTQLVIDQFITNPIQENHHAAD